MKLKLTYTLQELLPLILRDATARQLLPPHDASEATVVLVDENGETEDEYDVEVTIDKTEAQP